MTEHVYKLKTGKVISAYEDEKGNISITKEAFEKMVNGWDAGYQKGFMDGVDDTTIRIDVLKTDAIDGCISKIDELPTYYAGDKKGNAITPKMLIKEDVIKVLKQLGGRNENQV